MMIDIQTPLGRATAEQVAPSLLPYETLAGDRRMVSWRFTCFGEVLHSETLAFSPKEDVSAHLRYWVNCLTSEGQAAHDALCEQMAEQARNYARSRRDDLSA